MGIFLKSDLLPLPFNDPLPDLSRGLAWADFLERMANVFLAPLPLVFRPLKINVLAS